MTDDLTPDLTRTVALLGDGYRITAIARGKRAQERTEMLSPITLTTDEQARALSRSYRRDVERAAEIVLAAAEVAEAVGDGPHLTIAVHGDDLLAAALSLPMATRRDYVSSDTGRPAVACTVGRVTFYGSVRP